MCDVLALGETGEVEADIQNALLSYLDTETDWVPLNAYRECSQPLETRQSELNY